MKFNPRPPSLRTVDLTVKTNTFIVGLQTCSSKDRHTTTMWETLLSYTYDDYEPSQSERDVVAEQR